MGIFFALAFGLGWGTVALLIVFMKQIEAIFGPVGYTNPMFILAVYSPAIAGVFLVWRHYGLRGLDSFFRRLTLWRMPMAWWLFLLLGIPAGKYLGAAIKGTATQFPIDPWYGIFPALIAAVQSAWSFGPYVIGVLALSVLLTPMFNAAKGSILIAALFHFQMNGPAWPDAQPWENYIFAAAAVVIVLLNRKAMLTRGSGVTAILMPGEGQLGALTVDSRSAMPSTPSEPAKR